MKPCVGVSMNYSQESSGVDRAYLDSTYLDFLFDSGAIAVPVALTEDAECLNGQLDRLDGVLFTGGLDLTPVLWQEQKHPQARLVHPRRQIFEFKLYEAAQKRRLPIMGICLGIQMINVAHGGSLYQHLPESPGLVDHGGEGRTTEHKVRLDKYSRLYEVFMKEEMVVGSCHHQGVNSLGESLLAAAVADDGVVEAIERPDYPFLLAVQWHPERDMDNPINRGIVECFLRALVMNP
ncbi:MAG: gamma-glutamyl-gamma-aminobutyrate hydrolase family protein [Sedimentisphaerales bacterium]|nr:gamma-glutamyl-gamma-aminobutyrate hydrolase family protein [Sedimentisphaerales bacterium]